MRFDQRARRAAQGIHRAVEVMEMSTSTKEPRKVERFDRFRDRKQRNRRIGALLVAAVLTIAMIVVATNVLERSDTKVPVMPPPRNGGIVFGESDQNGTHVFTMNPDGTDVRAIGSTPLAEACWSWMPDGSKILIDGRAGVGLATINPDGTGYREISQQKIGCGALSPDGSRFVFGGHKGTYTARASDGGDLVRLSNFRGMYATYSPDGTQIVFTPSHNRAHYRSHHVLGLWVVNADGTDLHLVVAHMMTARPSWSPDGRSIVFEARGSWSPSEFGPAVYVIHADGSGLRRIQLGSALRLSEALYPSWSPDGTRFLFVGLGVNRRSANLFTVRTDGTDAEQITQTPGIYNVSPDWGTNEP